MVVPVLSPDAVARLLRDGVATQPEPGGPLVAQNPS